MDMIEQAIHARTYTPVEVAEILQLNKNTVYDLIKRGELIAKRIGSVYRIPAKSIYFVFTGLDFDIYQAEQEDIKNIDKVQEAIRKVRSKAYECKTNRKN